MNENVILEIINTGERFPITSGYVTIGRGKDCDLVLPDSSVSRKHAEIRRERDGWFIYDCNSSNGVYADGKRIPADTPYKLIDGCRLRFATQTQMVFHLGAYESEETGILEQDEVGTMILTDGLGQSENLLNKKYDLNPKNAQAPQNGFAHPGYPQWSGQGQAWANAGAQMRDYEPTVVVPRKPAKKKKIWIWPVAILALAILAFFGWCGYAHFSCVRAIEDGRYTEAIELADKDLFFGKTLKKEATYKAGQKFFSEGDYQSAAAYFSDLGDEAREEWGDALIAQAGSMIAADDPEGALELLKQIEGETRAQKPVAQAKFAIAEKMLAAKDYDGAKAIADEISPELIPEVEDFYHRLYWAKGLWQVEIGSFTGASSCMEKCVENEKVLAYRGILKSILAADYSAAVEQIFSAQEQGIDEIPLDTWRKNLIGANVQENDANGRLNKTEALKMLSPATVMDPQSDEMKEKVAEIIANQGDKLEPLTDSEDVIVYNDLDMLYDQCGAEPKGKILIVRQQTNFGRTKTNYGIAMDLMELLSADRYPSSLAEVEYVILISYDYTVLTTYTSGTVAIRVDATVKTIGMPDRQTTFNSGTISGGDPPSTIYYFGAPPEYYDGTEPQVESAVCRAIASVR